MHSKGKWLVADLGHKLTIGSSDIGAVARIENTVSGKPLTDEDRANARRIVNCVNACDDISDELLEKVIAHGGTLKSALNYGIANHTIDDVNKPESLESAVESSNAVIHEDGSITFNSMDDLAKLIASIAGDAAESLKLVTGLIQKHNQNVPDDIPVVGINDHYITIGDAKTAIKNYINLTNKFK